MISLALVLSRSPVGSSPQTIPGIALPGSALTVAVTSMPRSTREMSVSETLTTTSAQPPQFSRTTGWPGETFWLISTKVSATVHACGAVSRE